MKKCLITFVLLLFVSTPQATAQSPPILLSPAKQELTAQPGSVAEAAITLHNNSNTLQTVSVTARDFEASTEMSGEPQILETANKTYGISNWFTDSNIDKKLTVPGGKKVTYSAKFRVPADATARTYFGAVMFSNTSTDGQHASVGSLVFITVGNPATQLSVQELTFDESNDAARQHGEFRVVVSNAGPGLSKPFLKLRVTDNSDGTIVELEPEASGSILPDSSRVFTFIPSSELPNEDMTATVSVVDQQGTVADKSIQLAHDTKDTPAVNAITPEKPNPTLPIIIGAGMTLLLLGASTMLWVARHKQTQALTPNQKTSHQSTQSTTELTDTPHQSP